MTSILTNVSAQTALQTLRSVQGNLQETQDRISTGLEVRAAKDNPAFFLVSSQVNGDKTVVDGLNDNLTLSVNAARTATNGINSINGTINEIQTTLTTADSGQALNELQFTLDNLVSEIEGTINATSFNGINLLAGNGTSEVTTTITRDNGQFNISTFILREQDLANVTTFDEGTGYTLDAAYQAYRPDAFQRIDGANAAGIGSDGVLDYTVDGDDDASAVAGFQVTGEAYDAIEAALSAFGATAADLATARTAADAGDGTFTVDPTAANYAGVDFTTFDLDGDGAAETDFQDFIEKAVVGDAAVRNAVANSGFSGTIRSIQVAGAGGNVQAGLVVADAILNELNLAASTLGTFERTLEARQNFLETLSDSLEQGVSSLIEANLDEESSRLQALQVQEQLAIQSLQIANQRPQNILSLFR